MSTKYFTDEEPRFIALSKSPSVRISLKVFLKQCTLHFGLSVKMETVLFHVSQERMINSIYVCFRFMSLRYKALCTELESGSCTPRYENMADDLQEQWTLMAFFSVFKVLYSFVWSSQHPRILVIAVSQRWKLNYS